YPAGGLKRFYSEQYLLAVHLLARGASAEILLPNAFIAEEPDLAALLDPLWSALSLTSAEKHGFGFWMVT
ncbi:MAG: class I SAM-dependent methyltransferase, partial [Desulfobulbaceae bacterium]|nr:class I SAM-dependent methyltransferase [Desulfobulbaceae bacterium]